MRRVRGAGGRALDFDPPAQMGPSRATLSAGSKRHAGLVGLGNGRGNRRGGSVYPLTIVGLKVLRQCVRRGKP
eukprot:530091-Pleurochrysis_carterae.AAC.1